MKSLIDYKIKDMSSIMGGTRHVTWRDVDGDGTLDKVITVIRGGKVRRRTVRFS